MCIEKNVSSVVSVCETDKNPHWMYQLGDAGNLVPFLENGASNRQNLPSAYALNGAVYVFKISALLQDRKIVDGNTLGYLMPPERSFDIDTELDFEICDYLKKRMDAND